MNERDEVLLRDMLEASRKAVSFLEGRRRRELDEDDMLEFAVVRALEVIGEAASKVSDETKSRFAHIPWRVVIGMRNKLIHDYAHVDNDIIWDTVINDLPGLIKELESALE